jgi:enoyl-CoA hydratase/carnithine racemase
VTDDPLGASHKLAAACAARSPDAIRAIKALINEGWQMSDADSLALEARLQSGIIGGKNQLEAVSANLDKRKPDFSD